MKAALRGISIVFDSGVDGAGGQAARQITGNRTCGRFRPQVSHSSYVICCSLSCVVQYRNLRVACVCFRPYFVLD